MHLSLQPHHLDRYREFATLLLKHRRGDFMRSAGLDEMVEPDGHPDPRDSAQDAALSNRAEALAEDLERLGPTFVKLGQLLSTRSDLLPPEHIAALARLQDSCEPFPYADVERLVQDELGARMSRIFKDFQATPIAAASLAQVHRAELRDGRQVAVKVQRPGIRRQLADDLQVIGELAEFLDAHSEKAHRLALNNAFGQFKRVLVAELDYGREATNLRTLKRVLEGREHILVPAPYDDFTTSRVLTMDFVDGRKVTEITALARIDVDFSQLADELFGAYLDQILVAGFFHADPHPGNLLITADHRIALIDVGMVGRLTADMRRHLAKLMLAVLNGRGSEVVRISEQLGTPQDDFEPTVMQNAVDELMAMTQGPLADMDVGHVFMELSRRSMEAGLRPAPEMALLGKTLLNLQQAALVLDPQFDPLEAMRRHIPELMQSQVDSSFGGLVASLVETKEFLEQLPGRVNRAMDVIGSGRIDLRVQAFDETQFLKGLHRLANVAAAGLILAALIVGSALLAGQRGGAGGVTGSIALVVFAIAAVLSLTLLGWMAYSSRKVRARRR